MDTDDKVPVVVRHVFESDISQYAGVVDKDVYPAEILDGSINDAVAMFNAVIIGDGRATLSPDLLNNRISGLRGLSIAFQGATQIVDDDICSTTAEEETVGLAESNRINERSKTA